MKKIAYITNHSSFFESHILPIAKEAQLRGFHIKLFCGEGGSKIMEMYSKKSLKKNKVSFKKHNFSASGINFVNEFLIFIKFFKSVKKYNPDIIHAATPKGIIYGGLTSFLLKTRSTVIFVTGLGFLFSNKLNLYEKLIKHFYLLMSKIIFKKKNLYLVIENNRDLKFYEKKYNLKKRIKLLNGSGVDLKLFKPTKKKKDKIILMPSRVLKEKGVDEFSNAANIIRKKYRDWKFIVLGSLDYGKSSSYSKYEIENLKKKGLVFINFRPNILKFLEKTSILCLPSYREGFSKTLSEAVACGIPIVTTNVSGCKELVFGGKTGLLCKPRDYVSLKYQLEKLIKDSNLRNYFSKNGPELAKKKLDVKIIVQENINLYLKLLRNTKNDK